MLKFVASIAAFTAAMGAAPVQQLAPSIHLIAGSIEPGRQPDGNSVVIDAPAGLIVVDTGRHAWHRDKIAAFAAARGKPIVAIVNTHWHLDHVSGNLALKASRPVPRVYATAAIDGALEGFLADGARRGRESLASGNLDPITVEEIRTDLATIDAGEGLWPDVAVSVSGTVGIGGRMVDLHVAHYAATEADLWLYDAGTRIAVVGDLVTLPAPFLDTACPDGWRRALAEVAGTPFTTLVPGHGAPMTRAQFENYRKAFEALLACASGSSDAAVCATDWAKAAEPLPGSGPAARARATALHYVGRLRADGGRSKYCPAGAQ